jgi:hypothetical protein
VLVLDTEDNTLIWVSKTMGSISDFADIVTRYNAIAMYSPLIVFT